MPAADRRVKLTRSRHKKIYILLLCLVFIPDAAVALFGIELNERAPQRLQLSSDFFYGLLKTQRYSV